MLYYRAQDGITADIIPYYENGLFYLYYLHDYRDAENRGEGTPWRLIRTKDFVEYEEMGEVLPRGTEDEQDLYVFTGSVFKEAEGKYHIFYTGHNPHLRAQGHPEQAVMHAKSSDLIHWEKQKEDTFYAPLDSYEPHDWRDPFVYRDEKNGCYRMLLAARQNQKFISMDNLQEAVIKVIAGPEKRSRVVPQHERRLTAYHEAGHAVMHHCLESVDPVHQVTIVPRGQAGGMTISLPADDRGYYSKRYMEEEIAALLGGRVAESLFLSDISTGASNDIQRASSMARKMVMTYGMSEKLGPVSFDSGHDEVFIGRSMAQAKAYSEEVAARIDTEVKGIIDTAYRRCEEVLERHREKMEAVAAYLLEHETMSGEDFASVMGFPKAVPAEEEA